ncbi:histidine kinase [Imhoffiella purpurea]|uniref:Oxygen sensor histidine kinase NreB n=1 Tax=Imhoffiella purpurea TaxID=1249627 RepID=W9V986_9GAMM|nr:histidine kinase [Imhoffiella purpurea]EXJ16173.1 Response Regulator Receiver Signal Transduction Histidine Kinase [Imhoffiella purpurea]
MDVHQATALALRGLEVEARPIQLLHAHSASEAYELLTRNRDIAAVLLDVVMESDQAGLFLVRRIREELGDDAIRIILRTGQSGMVPQIDTIRAYDINDYKTKSELTRTALFACLSAAIRSYRQIRELKDAKRDLEEQGLELIRSRTKLRALTDHRERVREEERKHIARELHDNMGQYLTALRIETSMLEMLFPEPNPEVFKRLHTMRELIDQTIMDTRRMVSNLRPAALDLGLVSAAEWLISDFQSRTGIRCGLQTPREGELDLDQELATTLFRILQESLTNVSRYADAKHVDIRITRSSGLLQLEVRDDGCGFDPAAVREKTTFGLMGIRERVLIYGGSARIESALGQGTRLWITLPLIELEKSP